MDEPRWVPRLVVEAIHFDQIREHGGLPGLRDENGLEAALARPRQKWSFEPKSSLSKLAAAYAFGLARAHPFQDGNKRVAFVTMVVFLGLNGFELETSELEVVDAMTRLAVGTMSEEELTDWPDERVVA